MGRRDQSGSLAFAEARVGVVGSLWVTLARLEVAEFIEVRLG